MTIEAALDAVISAVIDREGRTYTNNPLDAGGPTKFGITLATLRAARKNLSLQASDVEALTEDEAKRIYYDRYVVMPGFVHIVALAPLLGAKLVDVGVNCGTKRASIWLQQAMNAFNRSYKTPADYPEVVVDGDVGLSTIDALATFCQLRGRDRAARVLMRAINCLQGAYYLALGTKNPTQEAFMLGWFDSRIS